VRDIQTVPSAVALPLTLPVQAPLPLFNPLEIQLKKEDTLAPEEKDGGNPLTKAASGRDIDE